MLQTKAVVGVIDAIDAAEDYNVLDENGNTIILPKNATPIDLTIKEETNITGTSPTLTFKIGSDAITAALDGSAIAGTAKYAVTGKASAQGVLKATAGGTPTAGKIKVVLEYFVDSE